MNQRHVPQIAVILVLLAAVLAGASPFHARAAAPVAPVAPAGSSIMTLKLPAAPPVAAVDTGSIQFIGTATVLVRYRGLVILTDPNFLHKGEHVHLGYGLTSERLTNPALDFDQLPPIDLVVLSHMHEDHFDKLVQQKLDKSTPIVTTPGAARALKKLGFARAAGLAP